MTEKKYSITPEHESMLPAWRDKWIEFAMRTTPQTASDREKCVEAINGLYKAGNLKQAPVFFVSSPFVGAISWSIISCLIWLNKNEQHQKELFGKKLDNADKAVAIESVIDRLTTKVSVKNAIKGVICEVSSLPPTFFTNPNKSTINPEFVSMLNKAILKWANGWNGGNHWAGFSAYVSFFREVVKLNLPEYSKWIHYENATIYGSHRFMHSDFCLISDFPIVIKKDKQNRSHSANGPAIAWSDGVEINSWHGQQIP